MSDGNGKTRVRSRTITWEDPAIGLEAAQSLSGMEYLNQLMQGRIPMSPFMRLVGIRLVEAEPGRVLFEFNPEEHHYNVANTVHGGAHSTLLDHVMGHAVHSTLPVEYAYTTLEIKVNFVRPITDRSGTVFCEGRVVHPGRRIATAEGRLTDRDGQIFSHGLTTCLVFSKSGG
ncbi:MAG: PaaI family thioesterase [Proteobacteria bacterium]|nr:PaaI family thioesterase [Pseudomonadota bacterium]